ncbi:hypothetical protein B9Z55_010329 [Caenorhabditis nigoni]|uniref:Uncharacterized protein n=1 Tax=Caenorhabditis nigoni TaxID=1611254 RepID=A0A2G5UFD5_9PELO|nr:hypothetical protein B9Z55_010329 [Caenorhabditis nigoni]
MIAPTFFPISITFERFLAIKNAKYYERTKVFWGPIITIFLILFCFLIICLVFLNANIVQGSVSFVFIPASVAPRVHLYF